MGDGRAGFWVKIALGFLLRSGRTTAALSVMVIVAVSALIFLSALAVGVNDAMLENTVGLFSGHITGSDLPEDLSPRDLTLAGVSGVAMRRYLAGVLTGGPIDAALTLCGVVPEAELSLTALEKKTVSGRYPKPGEKEIFIGKALADELGAGPGETLQFEAPSLADPLVLKVSGTYETGIDRLDRQMAFCPLTVLPAADGTWSAAIFLTRGTSPGKVIDAYGRRWPGRGRYASWETLMPDLSQLIDLQYFSMGIVIVLVFGVVAVGIACIFVIFILKNLREYGIMKAMGVTGREIFLLIATKVGLMNAAACTIGILLGAIAVWTVAGAGGIDISAFTSHNRYFTVSGIISPRLTPFSLLAPPVTAFFFGLAAAVWPAALVARRKAAEIIRMI